MSDGKKRKIVRDLTGQTFGYLTILRVSETPGGHGKRAIWWAQCVCGKALEIRTDGFRSNRKPTPSSCGCMTSRLRSEGRKTHGMSRHKAFAVWRSMLDRCTLPSHQAWKNYGGRGITVCARWLNSFTNFWTDMGPTYQQGLTLDRRDNSRGYELENCHWVTPKAQARNTRANRIINTPQGPMLVCEAAEVSGIGMTTLLYRANHGWTGSEMFLPPKADNRLR